MEFMEYTVPMAAIRMRGRRRAPEYCASVVLSQGWPGVNKVFWFLLLHGPKDG